jgi:hypothetical protein
MKSSYTLQKNLRRSVVKLRQLVLNACLKLIKPIFSDGITFVTSRELKQI